MTIVEAARGVTGGVDTHLDVHVAAALDPLGALLGTERFDTDPAGYKALLTWLEASVRSPRWAWRARAPMVRAWPGSCAEQTSR